MHGISYRPTDLSLIKGFSKKFSFEDFHNFIPRELSRAVVHDLSDEEEKSLGLHSFWVQNFFDLRSNQNVFVCL